MWSTGAASVSWVALEDCSALMAIESKGAHANGLGSGTQAWSERGLVRFQHGSKAVVQLATQLPGFLHNAGGTSDGELTPVLVATRVSAKDNDLPGRTVGLGPRRLLIRE